MPFDAFGPYALAIVLLCYTAPSTFIGPFVALHLRTYFIQPFTAIELIETFITAAILHVATFAYSTIGVQSHKMI